MDIAPVEGRGILCEHVPEALGVMKKGYAPHEPEAQKHCRGIPLGHKSLEKSTILRPFCKLREPLPPAKPLIKARR